MAEQLTDINTDIETETTTEIDGDMAIANAATAPTPEKSIDQSAASDLIDYIQLHLNAETWAAIEMSRVDTVISVNAKSIVPIPNMPSCFLGLFNHRGHVYWVIDLPHLLGIAPLEDSNHSYAALIITPQQERSQVRALPANSGSGNTGNRAGKIETANASEHNNRSPLILAVKEIEGMIKFHPDQIQVCIPPIPPGLQAYTKQCLDNDRDKLYILDVEAIANSSILRA